MPTPPVSHARLLGAVEFFAGAVMFHTIQTAIATVDLTGWAKLGWFMCVLPFAMIAGRVTGIGLYRVLTGDAGDR